MYERNRPRTTGTASAMSPLTGAPTSSPATRGAKMTEAPMVATQPPSTAAHAVPADRTATFEFATTIPPLNGFGAASWLAASGPRGRAPPGPDAGWHRGGAPAPRAPHVLPAVPARGRRGAAALRRALAAERAAAGARGPAVRVDDDLAPGESGVPHRAADR